MGLEVYTGKVPGGLIHVESSTYKMRDACDKSLELEQGQWEIYPEIYKEDAYYCHECFGISKELCKWDS